MVKKTARRMSRRYQANWEQIDWLEHDFAKDPAPLIEALKSDAPLPKHLRIVLIDLLERHRLKLKHGAKRIPSYRPLSDARAKLEAADEEYHGIIRTGPITRTEMDVAVEVLKKRAKHEGRGHIKFDPKAAAQQLREEQAKKAAEYIATAFDLETRTLQNFSKDRRISHHSRRAR